MKPMTEVIVAFDEYLGAKGLSFSGTIIGGAALIVMEVLDRVTQDIDCLDPKIPDEIKKASVEFAEERADDLALKENWLNNGPASLKLDLPKSWRRQVVRIYEGKNLSLYTLGRLDLLRSKLFAYCDRQQDLEDCEALRPTLDELQTCLPWLVERDANPMWPAHVKTSLHRLAEKLGYEFKPE
jgi:hypothetical protein